MAAHIVYLTASQNALKAITRLYDFVWPTAAALWNLRWQVAGYNAVRGSASVEELEARFVGGSKIHGANLHRACLEQTWEEQQDRLGEMVLVNLFAIYESWLSAALDELGFPAKVRKAAEKNLQFPTPVLPGKYPGITAALKSLTSPESSAFKSEIYPVAAASPKVHTASLEAMMVFYRYFKEVRNCLVHGHGVASPAADESFKEVDKLLTGYEAAKTVGGSPPPFPIPRIAPLTIGTPVKVDLHAVVGFGELIRRIVFALETEFLQSAHAESLIVRRWKAQFGRVMLKADSKKRHGKIQVMLRKLRLPVPKTTQELECMLKRHSLIL